MDYEISSDTLSRALGEIENLNEIEDLNKIKVGEIKNLNEIEDLNKITVVVIYTKEESLREDTTFKIELNEVLKYFKKLKHLEIKIKNNSKDENDKFDIDLNSGISEQLEALRLEGINLATVDLDKFFREHPYIDNLALNDCNISNINFLNSVPDSVEIISLGKNPISAEFADDILRLRQEKFKILDIRGCEEVLTEFEKRSFEFSKFLTEHSGKLDGSQFYDAFGRALSSKEYSVRDMQQLSKYIDFFSEKRVQEQRTVHIDDLKEYDKQYIESINLFGRGENTTVVVTPKIAEQLMGRISKDINIRIAIKNASELSVEQLEVLEKNYNLKDIEIDDPNQSLNIEQITPYDIETYKMCRKVIDVLLEGIDLSKNPNDANRDKRIFREVIKRLAYHMCYDYESLKLENEEEVSEVSIICRNMQGGLLNFTCVCAGYTEIVRNVFSCCGIDARYIYGFRTDGKVKGHAWNQIKLDGKWYNMDLTWDRDRIVEGKEPKYLLQSDADFKEHPYFSEGVKREECNETLPVDELMQIIYGQTFEREVQDSDIEGTTKTKYYSPVKRIIKRI